MKKLLPLLLAGLLLLGAACSGPETDPGTTTPNTSNTENTENSGAPETAESAYELLQLANQKIETTSMSINMDITVSMAMNGETLSSETTSSKVTVAMNGDDVRFSMNMGMNVEGTPIDINAFYIDGYYYMDLMGMKVKGAMPMDDAMDQAAVGYMDLNEAFIKDQVVDGNTLSFTLTGEAMNEIFASAMGPLMAQMDDEGVTLTYDDMLYVIQLDNEGMPTKLTATAAFTVADDEDSIVVGMELVMDLTDIGTATVEIPDDLDEYIETDLSSLM